MPQMTLPLTGPQLRDEGIAKASRGDDRKLWLEQVRTHAAMLARARGSVTADDIQGSFCLPAGAHQNLWGAVFNDARFVCLGFVLSKRPAAHARAIRKWGIHPDAQPE